MYINNATISESTAKSGMVACGFMESTAARIDDYAENHPDAIYLIGNNPQPGAYWKQPGIVCEQIARTNSRYHGKSLRTAYAVREMTTEELGQALNTAVCQLERESGWQTEYILSRIYNRALAMAKLAKSRGLDVTTARRELVKFNIRRAA